MSVHLNLVHHSWHITPVNSVKHKNLILIIMFYLWIHFEALWNITVDISSAGVTRAVCKMPPHDHLLSTLLFCLHRLRTICWRCGIKRGIRGISGTELRFLWGSWGTLKWYLRESARGMWVEELLWMTWSSQTVHQVGDNSTYNVYAVSYSLMSVFLSISYSM